MKIYQVTRTDEADYDEAAGFVIVAPDRETARTLASREAGDEGADIWLDPHLALVHQVGLAAATEREGVLLRDYWES